MAADPEVAEDAKDGGSCSVDASFSIPLATARVVSVVFTGSEYTTGAAHPLPFRRSAAFDLQLGRPLADADVFAPGGKERAAQLVLAKLRGYGDEPGGEWQDEPANATKLAAELANWTFRADGVEVVFPVYSIASYAAGEIPVWLGYDELRGILRPDAPLPPR